MYFFQINGLAEAVLRNNNWELLVEGMRRSSQPGTFSQEDFEHYREAWWRKGAMRSMLNWYRALFRRPFRLSQGLRLFHPNPALMGSERRCFGA